MNDIANMKPVQRLAHFLLKLATQQQVSEEERIQAADCYSKVQSLISAEFFLTLSRIIEEDMPNQRALLELGIKWKKHTEQNNGLLSEEDASTYLLEKSLTSRGNCTSGGRQSLVQSTKVLTQRHQSFDAMYPSSFSGRF